MHICSTLGLLRLVGKLGDASGAMEKVYHELVELKKTKELTKELVHDAVGRAVTFVDTNNTYMKLASGMLRSLEPKKRK